MSEDLSALDTFTPEEQAYFENGAGESAPALAPKPTPEPEPELDEPETDGAEVEADEAPETPEPKAEKPRTVPHAALHEERQRRKELEAQLRQTTSRFEQLLSRLEPQTTQPAAEAEDVPVPDPDLDPVGAIKFATEQARQAKIDREQRAAAERQAAETNRFVDRYRKDAETYTQEAPDFGDAYAHLKTSRAQELEAMGLDGGQVARQLIQEEFQIAQMAYQAGKNPAEVLYAVARQRGYAKAAPAETKPAKPTPEEKLQAVEAGMRGNKSLSSTGGRANTAEVQVADLMKMSDEAFGAWMDKNPAKARRLFGA